MIFKSPPTQPRYGSLIPGDPPTMLNTPPNIPKLRCHSDPHPPPGLSGPQSKARAAPALPPLRFDPISVFPPLSAGEDPPGQEVSERPSATPAPSIGTSACVMGACRG